MKRNTMLDMSVVWLIASSAHATPTPNPTTRISEADGMMMCEFIS